jgi:hypothetical protein
MPRPGPRRRKRQAASGAYGAALFLVLAAMLVPGCASDRINFWPIYYREKNPQGIERVAGDDTTTEILYPIFSMESTPERHIHAVRPLYNYEKRRDGSLSQLQFLWPLGLWRNRPDTEKQFWLLPLIYHGSRRGTVTDEWQTRGFVFPLVYWGRRRPEGSYFAIFPIGGVIRRIFVERFRFVLFPIWSQVNEGDYSRHDVLWPIISWGGTPDGKREILRIWPFYVHKKKIGHWEHNWAPWPFVLWGKERQTSKHPQRYWGVFPFYISKVSEDAAGDTVAYDRRVLYLLFVRRKDERERNQLSAWAVLWPLTNFETGAKRREFRIFPLFWMTDQMQRQDRYAWRRYRILWPIIWIDHDRRTPGVRKRGILAVPFYWDYASEWTDKSRERRITFWPLYTFKRDRDGSIHHYVLSFGWHDVTSGWKRNLRAFFDLFQYHDQADGKKSIRFLWRLFSMERDGPWRRLEINPLFTWERDERYGRWSTLFGIIAREQQGERRRWRVFYIPFGDRIERVKR